MSSHDEPTLDRPNLPDRIPSRVMRAAQWNEEQETLSPDVDEERHANGVCEETLPLLKTIDKLPVYENIYRIRRLLIATIDDPYTPEQLRSPQVNLMLIRPLTDRLYNPDDVSIVYSLLINRLQFLREQSFQAHNQTVAVTRANVCELLASKCLRRRDQEHPGRQGLLNLASVLVIGFEPFQNAPEEVIREKHRHAPGGLHASHGFDRKLSALEVAIVSGSKSFLSTTASHKIVDAVYRGRIVYTPTSFIDIIPDRYKSKPVSLYDPRKGPLLNQYRLIIPRTRTLLDNLQFCILFTLYSLAMANRDHTTFTGSELIFCIYAFGWGLDEVASVLEHGIQVHTQNLWAFLDLAFLVLYFIYFLLRMHGLATGDLFYARQALDIISCAAPVVLPRLAFSLMPDNMLFISLRAMMPHFFALVALAFWCFGGFYLALRWLMIESDTRDLDESDPVTVSKWMLYIWFGLDGEGIQRSVDFHRILGPIIMVTFAFLGNTLFLTILVSMLTYTFSKLVEDAAAEIQFRRAVLTFENVKSDAIFSYQPPFNILALAFLVPLRFVTNPRWFHKIHVTSVRFLNAPLLLLINFYERRYLWKSQRKPLCTAGPSKRTFRLAGWFSLSRFSAHGECQAVFDVEPPQALLERIDEEVDEGAELMLTPGFDVTSPLEERSGARRRRPSSNASDPQQQQRPAGGRGPSKRRMSTVI